MKVLLLLASALLIASATASPTDTYPLTTCVVSGDKLGAMSSPVVINYQGTEVRFCCHDCVETFKENPAKYLAKLKEAKASAAKN